MRTIVFRSVLVLIAASLLSCGESIVGSSGGPPPSIVEITSPPTAGGISIYSTYIEFTWESFGEVPAECTRYIWSELIDTSGNYNPGFDFIEDLNENPARYESRWSDWSCPDSGSEMKWSLILGDDEELRSGRYHFLAVQSRSTADRVDTVFVKDQNVRHFLPRRLNEPYLKIYEPLLGGFRFVGSSLNPSQASVPPGTPLKFRWEADPSRYFSRLKGYRFGWDIDDLEGWDAEFSPLITSTPSIEFNSGIHTLYIEASDMAGNRSLARITLEIVPWTMDRDLLWIDDFKSVDMPIPDLSWPPEFEHDDFWLSICARAPGFDPSRDVYDCGDAPEPPGVALAGRYKNIIWTYSTQDADWTEIISFVPESLISNAQPSPQNVISIFLRSGGHIWTLGRSDRGGGLAAVRGESNPEFPFRVDREIAGIGSSDPSGSESMAWNDYCVTVIDKVQANFRDHSWMPDRYLDHYDVFRSAYLDPHDPVTASYTGFPGELRLREEVVASGAFFSFDSLSSPGGFTFVEVYDPAYWMNVNLLISRHCFHPLYRMRTAESVSAVNEETVALWITGYRDITADGVAGAVPAPSIHFGLPLWFFEKSTVDSIADVIFDIWEID